MDIGFAAKALLNGKKVARAGWNGNAAKTGFVPPSRDPVVFAGMGYIKMASGEVAIFDPEDFDKVDGLNAWTLMGQGYPSYTKYNNGSDPSGKETIRLHDIILAGHPMVDHENGDRLDNRKRNLRPCTSSQNNANRPSLAGSSSRFKGVTWDKSREKWMSAIMYGGKSKTLGRFDSEEAAARVYDANAREIHGEFARLNFPPARMYVVLIAGDAVTIAGDHISVSPCMGLKTPSNTMQPGWNASTPDVLAQDWEIMS